MTGPRPSPPSAPTSRPLPCRGTTDWPCSGSCSSTGPGCPRPALGRRQAPRVPHDRDSGTVATQKKRTRSTRPAAPRADLSQTSPEEVAGILASSSGLDVEPLLLAIASDSSTSTSTTSAWLDYYSREKVLWRFTRPPSSAAWSSGRPRCSGGTRSAGRHTDIGVGGYAHAGSVRREVGSAMECRSQPNDTSDYWDAWFP